LVSDIRAAIIIAVIALVGGASLGWVYSARFNTLNTPTVTITATETKSVTSIQTTSIFVPELASASTITESVTISPSATYSQNVTIMGPVSATYGNPVKVVFQSENTGV